MAGALQGGIRDRIECMRVRPLLQRYLDGELDARERERVATHLAACVRCGLAAEDFLALKNRLRGLAEPVDDGAVLRVERFLERLDDNDERE